MDDWAPVPHDAGFPTSIGAGDHVRFVTEDDRPGLPSGTVTTGRVWSARFDGDAVRYYIARDGDSRPTLHYVTRDAITHLSPPF